MNDPEAITIFAGIDGRTDTELPEWYRQRHGGDDVAVTATEDATVVAFSIKPDAPITRKAPSAADRSDVPAGMTESFE